jgi:hypothetical protein
LPDLNYPLVPKSIRCLRPGQFWAVPLRDGTFACGRVLDLSKAGGLSSRTTFLAGLADWHGSSEPTHAALHGCGIVRQGQAHLKTITATGGALLGMRPLELDGISPCFFKDSTGWPNATVYRGLQPVRPATAADADLPVLQAWGYLVIVGAAERHFLTPRGA